MIRQTISTASERINPAGTQGKAEWERQVIWVQMCVRGLVEWRKGSLGRLGREAEIASERMVGREEERMRREVYWLKEMLQVVVGREV